MKNILLLMCLVCVSAAFTQINPSDGCAGIPALPVNGSCINNNYVLPGAYANGGLITASCAFGNNRDDGWYQFVATSTTTQVQATGNRRLCLAAFTNCAGGTELACHTVNSGLASITFATTIGITYYIQIHRRSGNNNATMNGTICIQSITPPANDDPCGATALTVGATCVFNTHNNTDATNTAGVPAPGCANYNGQDVWFTATVPPSGNLIIDNSQGTITDGGMAVYSGVNCATLTLIECDDDDSGNGLMPMISVFSEPIGSTIYIRIWEYGGGTGTFDICAHEGPPVSICGNPANNDYCSDPALLTQGGGSWSSSTSATYSADTPGNINAVFCGSIENNSWYRFTALNTTEVFNFSTVNNCQINRGIQAHVYEVTNDVNGCCTGFTSRSNCWSPGAPGTGVVTATGLTIGNDYMLMVDGYAGDQCDFTVSGWSATGILPVTLTKFEAELNGSNIELTWETESEQESDFFLIQKSSDGLNWETIERMEAAGNSTATIEYSTIDGNPYLGINYYRLEQFDFNGKSWLSETISITTNGEKNVVEKLYPNPVRDNFFVELFNEEGSVLNISIQDFSGQEKYQQDLGFVSGKLKTEIQSQQFTAGMYFILILDSDGNIIDREKFVKL